MGNTFGKLYKLTTFGESHGLAIGGIIDGCPAGIELDFDLIQTQLSRRSPGVSYLDSSRKELDRVEFLSGIFEGKTTGTPIGFFIKNKDARSEDYDHIKDTFRPSHADFTYHKKYGIRDYRGGGRSSARETACRVVAGSVAAQILKGIGVNVFAYVSSIGDIRMNGYHNVMDVSSIDSNIVRCPDNTYAENFG